MFAPLTRAPHLLLAPSTGRYSVRLFRFMELVARPFEGRLTTLMMKFSGNSGMPCPAIEEGRNGNVAGRSPKLTHWEPDKEKCY